MHLVPRALAESVGTALLVTVGCGAIVVDEATGALGTWGVAVAFFFAVALPVWMFARASGAHLNPAVTIALASRGRSPWREVPAYVAAQLAGAVVAAAGLSVVAPEGSGLGATSLAPGVGPLAGAAWEAAATALLVAVVFVVASRATLPRVAKASAIAAVVGLAAAVAGPLTGASLNPARSLGPAWVAGRLDPVLVLYVAAPLVGALFGAAAVCRFAPRGWCCAETSVTLRRLPA